MLTRSAVNNYLANFVQDLVEFGIVPERVVLFGSYAGGRPHNYSDIDVAVWHKSFTGCLSMDYVALMPVLRKYPLIELHTFECGDDAITNPFIAEIERRGIVVIPHQAIQQIT
jgi:predicted nucleotidyltransferase